MSTSFAINSRAPFRQRHVGLTHVAHLRATAGKVEVADSPQPTEDSRQGVAHEDQLPAIHNGLLQGLSHDGDALSIGDRTRLVKGESVTSVVVTPVMLVESAGEDEDKARRRHRKKARPGHAGRTDG